RNSVRRHATKDASVADRKVNRTRERKRGPTAAVGAVAAGAVRVVEDVEVENLVRRDVLRINRTPSRCIVAADEKPGREHEPRDGDRARQDHCRSSPSRSRTSPGASIPARTANGKRCQVWTRSCRDTTSPATTPNPICDSTNQNQS